MRCEDQRAREWGVKKSCQAQSTVSLCTAQRKKICGVYAIYCLANDRVYVGSSIDVERRKREHLGNLRKGKHANPHLQAAWNKYGESFFRWSLLATPQPALLLQVEQVFIDAVFSMGLAFNGNRSASTYTPQSSQRERDTATLLSLVTPDDWATMSNKAIAEVIGVACRTVQVHRPAHIPSPGMNPEYLSEATKKGHSRAGYDPTRRRATTKQKSSKQKPNAEERRRERVRTQAPITCAHRRCGVEFCSLRPSMIRNGVRVRQFCSLKCRWAEEALLRHPQRMERKKALRARQQRRGGHPSGGGEGGVCRFFQRPLKTGASDALAVRDFEARNSSPWRALATLGGRE
jgi:group I intron endonuclease